MPIDPARKTAFDILMRVERGGYASDLLFAQTAGMDTRDAGLASEVVYGVLRYRAQLDFLAARLAKGKLDREVRTALRMGIYQLRYLDRIPPHAAVGTSVELVKQARKRSATGLVNAVLRKINRDPVSWPDRATELCQPAWLLDSWDRQYGQETADGIARAFLKPPETWVRLDGKSCLATNGIPPGARIQDIGSQSIVPLLDLQPGQTFLDLCAAPGNKTAQALETAIDAVGCDLHWKRLRELRGLNAKLVTLDAGRPLPFNRKFDRILVDAPCTGTGTLGRNPEIKWRIEPSAPAELQRTQRAILRNALQVLAPGGRVVYSTCSLEFEENEEVVKTYSPAEIRHRIPGLEPGDGFFAAVIA